MPIKPQIGQAWRLWLKETASGQQQAKTCWDDKEEELLQQVAADKAEW